MESWKNQAANPHLLIQEGESRICVRTLRGEASKGDPKSVHGGRAKHNVYIHIYMRSCRIAPLAFLRETVKFAGGVTLCWPSPCWPMGAGVCLGEVAIFRIGLGGTLFGGINLFLQIV